MKRTKIVSIFLSNSRHRGAKCPHTILPPPSRQFCSIAASTTLIGYNILSRLAEPLIVFHSCEPPPPSPCLTHPLPQNSLSPSLCLRSNATLSCSFFCTPRCPTPLPYPSTTLSYNLITRKAAQTAAREQGKRGRYILDFPSLETSSCRKLSEREREWRCQRYSISLVDFKG